MPPFGRHIGVVVVVEVVLLVVVLVVVVGGLSGEEALTGGSDSHDGQNEGGVEHTW